MSFLSYFKDLQLDYHYLHTLRDNNTHPSHTPRHKEKQTGRTTFTEIAHDDNISSIHPAFTPSNQLASPDTLGTPKNQPSEGEYLARIQIRLNHEDVHYDIYHDTTREHIIEFVEGNIEEQFHEEILGIIGLQIAKAARKLKENTARERRSPSAKENINQISVVKGQKMLTLLFVEKTLAVNLNKLCITHKLSERQKNSIIRSINRGDREVILG